MYTLVNRIYSSATASSIANFGQMLLQSINFFTPLYCQSPDSTATLFWQLPSGALLGDGVRSEGASVMLVEESLGLALQSSSAPEGVYNCVANGDVISSVYVTRSKQLLVSLHYILHD